MDAAMMMEKVSLFSQKRNNRNHHTARRRRSNSLPSWIIDQEQQGTTEQYPHPPHPQAFGLFGNSSNSNGKTLRFGKRVSVLSYNNEEDTEDSENVNGEESNFCERSIDFGLETSLHGLKYICQPRRHVVERIFWLIAFFIGLIMAGWLISQVWWNYISSPLIVTFEPFETTIDKIPFPAITICNMNKVLKSKAEAYMRLAQGPETSETTTEARKNVYYLDHVCSSSKSFSQMFNYSGERGQVDPHILSRFRVEDGDDEQRDVARFLQIASQPCEEMLLLCAWQDTAFNCSDLFKPIETDFGKCCTFNMIPNILLYKNLNNDDSLRHYDPAEIAGWSRWNIIENGLLLGEEDSISSFPRRQKRAGKSSGLSVLLNPDLPEYFCTSSDSHGFQLVKHLPIDTPKVVDFGIAIRPNSEVFMGLRPELTMVSDDALAFTLEKRNCYRYDEYPLAYYKVYTSSNCYEECLANQTYEICGCVSYYMPRDDTRDLCGASSFQCAETVRKSAHQIGIKSRCDACLPACTELEYFSETTFTPIQNGGDIWTKNNETPNWAGKNLSIVHIYLASDSSYARVRKELYGITDLIANTGGLMGLCLGFSGLSLIELIYFYTLRAWCLRRRRRRTDLLLPMQTRKKTGNRNSSSASAIFNGGGRTQHNLGVAVNVDLTMESTSGGALLHSKCSCSCCGCQERGGYNTNYNMS